MASIVQHAVILPGMRSRRRRHGDERGAVVVLFALLLTVLVVIGAIVVDLGSARQQKAHNAAAADAGALAGAKALEATTQVPAGCPDANCVAAYFSLASLASTPGDVAAFAATRSSCTIETPAAGETCWQYARSGSLLDVKTPYSLHGAAAEDSLVHVKICNDGVTTFARTLGKKSIRICGAATARNTGMGQGSTQSPAPAPDCLEDNFADANDEPTIYVFNPGDYPDEGKVLPLVKGAQTGKAKQILAVVFNGVDSDLDLSSIVFEAPTTVSGPTGQSVALPAMTPPDNHGPKSPPVTGIGYTVQSLDAAGMLQPYTAGGTFQAVIAYQLPDDAHLKVGGKSVAYTAALHAADQDQDLGAGADCGHTTWTFTHDGKAVTSTATACGENSFMALGVFPSDGKAQPGDSVGAYYADESPIQTRDITDVYWSSQPINAGIDFELSGGAFTDSAGHGYQIPPATASPGGYTLDPFPVGIVSKESYKTMIRWTLPDAHDPRWVNGIKYTVYLKAYDTDNNKPGNDCGQGTWSFILSGAASGAIRLVE
jgi:Putative Flp pilus-assembly TadE/G-like